MTARRTSISAYQNLQASGKASSQRARITGYVAAQSAPVTRRQIAVALGMDVSSVSGRVNELMGQGLRSAGKVKCPVTGIRVEALEILPAVPEQQGLFEGAA